MEPTDRCSQMFVPCGDLLGADLVRAGGRGSLSPGVPHCLERPVGPAFPLLEGHLTPAPLGTNPGPDTINPKAEMTEVVRPSRDCGGGQEAAGKVDAGKGGQDPRMTRGKTDARDSRTHGHPRPHVEGRTDTEAVRRLRGSWREREGAGLSLSTQRCFPEVVLSSRDRQ